MENDRVDTLGLNESIQNDKKQSDKMLNSNDKGEDMLTFDDTIIHEDKINFEDKDNNIGNTRLEIESFEQKDINFNNKIKNNYIQKKNESMNSKEALFEGKNNTQINKRDLTQVILTNNNVFKNLNNDFQSNVCDSISIKDQKINIRKNIENKKTNIKITKYDAQKHNRKMSTISDMPPTEYEVNVNISGIEIDRKDLEIISDQKTVNESINSLRTQSNDNIRLLKTVILVLSGLILIFLLLFFFE